MAVGTYESGITWLPPKITGIGHGDVFVPCETFRDEEDQFASNELIGRFVVYGVSMNTYTIWDSPYGNVEISWDDAHGGEETATLPVLERDSVQGSYFVVGVVRDKRYVPATFRFKRISYNDFAADEVVMGDTDTIKACPYSDGACAPLAPYEAFDIRVRSPFILGNYGECRNNKRKGRGDRGGRG